MILLIYSIKDFYKCKNKFDYLFEENEFIE
jgi:hypothetical protein